MRFDEINYTEAIEKRRERKAQLAERAETLLVREQRLEAAHRQQKVEHSRIKSQVALLPQGENPTIEETKQFNQLKREENKALQRVIFLLTLAYKTTRKITENWREQIDMVNEIRILKDLQTEEVHKQEE